MTVPVLESGWTHSSVTSVNAEISIAEPSGVVAGNLLIYIVGNERNVATAQWDDSTLKPSGFTLINTAGNADPDTHVAAFWRIATESEADPMVCNCQEAALQEGWYLRITGAHGTTPIDVVGADYNGLSAQTHAIPEITTLAVDALAFYLVASDGGDTATHSVDGTWGEVTEDAQATSGGLAMSFGTKNMGRHQIKSQGIYR